MRNQPGIECILASPAMYLGRRAIALLTNRAAIDTDGRTTADRLLRQQGVTMRCLLSPEHGFSARHGAGEHVSDDQMENTDIPIYSLYGSSRRPTAEMLKGVDLILVDLPDLPYRFYTYGSTLRYVLEAAAELHTTVLVADRPIPLPQTVDGPMLNPEVESFVGCLPTPACYGMTVAEISRFLHTVMKLDVDLETVPMQSYQRDGARPLQWRPPSPGIRTWDTALTYPVFVFCEALPALDYGRGTKRVFQVLGAPWIDAERLAAALTALPDLGYRPSATRYTARAGSYAGKVCEGIVLRALSATKCQPVTAFIFILAALRDLHGMDKILDHEKTRKGFFDMLIGSPGILDAIEAGILPGEIPGQWEATWGAFPSLREELLLY